MMECAVHGTNSKSITRFAVEDFLAIRTLGSWMQVGDERFDSEEIHHLYESDDYPLRRRTC
jgi:hypothetical protein